MTEYIEMLFRLVMLGENRIVDIGISLISLPPGLIQHIPNIFKIRLVQHHSKHINIMKIQYVVSIMLENSSKAETIVQLYLVSPLVVKSTQHPSLVEVICDLVLDLLDGPWCKISIIPFPLPESCK